MIGSREDQWSGRHRILTATLATSVLLGGEAAVVLAGLGLLPGMRPVGAEPLMIALLLLVIGLCDAGWVLLTFFVRVVPRASARSKP